VITQTWTNSGLGFSRFIGCLAANWQFHITAQGDFTPCDFTPLTFGNVRTEAVKDLWERMLGHPAYSKHQLSCRMQDSLFRKRYIDQIPEGAELPYAILDL
jgi:MoaA/NifB/PqqE/SkfB family radical SAM enzyme